MRGGARIEGIAAIAPTGALPSEGLFAAGAITDFPPNTTIIVTNLVNEKTVQVTVIIPSDNSNFLILLSQEAADKIALSSQYPGRVRVEKIINAVNENRVSNGDPDYDPQAQISGITLVKTANPKTETPPSLIEKIPPSEKSVDSSTIEKETTLKEKDTLKNSGLALVQAENRLPKRQPITIPADEEIASIKEGGSTGEKNLNESDFIEPLEETSLGTAQPYSLKGFSVPVLTTMEKGKYYLQLRSYNKPELVNSEIERVEKIEKKLLLIYIAEVSGKQVYRIIIGPITLDESDRLLRKYKAQGWTDAFVWHIQ